MKSKEQLEYEKRMLVYQIEHPILSTIIELIAKVWAFMVLSLIILAPVALFVWLIRVIFRI